MKQLSNSVFKWFMHIINIVSDIILIIMVLLAIFGVYESRSIAVFILAVFIIAGCCKAFMEQGGFMAWTAKGRKEFSDGYDAIVKKSNRIK